MARRWLVIPKSRQHTSQHSLLCALHSSFLTRPLSIPEELCTSTRTPCRWKLQAFIERSCLPTFVGYRLSVLLSPHTMPMWLLSSCFATRLCRITSSFSSNPSSCSPERPPVAAGGDDNGLGAGGADGGAGAGAGAVATLLHSALCRHQSERWQATEQ